ncbi:MAG: carbon monoxide dehydrogenase subunit G [Syntrophales bacterium LBB04]|nr:carbon monoxide dehydrogenase subunit G [Syntrophales bacterium LBB04]
MLMEGRFILEAPIQKVWDTLLEPETLLSCIPGAEKIERIDERTYDCVIKQKVGPISVKFKFKSTITKSEPPRHIEVEGEGEDIGKAGHFMQKSVVDLREISEKEVEVAYKTDAMIVGKLAMFGDRIMRAKAKKVEEEFTQALQEKLKDAV